MDRIVVLHKRLKPELDQLGNRDCIQCSIRVGSVLHNRQSITRQSGVRIAGKLSVNTLAPSLFHPSFRPSRQRPRPNLDVERLRVKALLPVLAMLPLVGCFGAHIATGAAPASPGDTFTCMTTALHDLGFSLVTSNAKTGYIDAEKRDAGSPGGAEYTNLDISIYANRDGETQFMIQTTRTHGGGSTGTADTGLPTLDSDVKASDAVAKRCGKP
jgi:hypothetical protein